MVLQASASGGCSEMNWLEYVLIASFTKQRVFVLCIFAVFASALWFLGTQDPNELHTVWSYGLSHITASRSPTHMKVPARIGSIVSLVVTRVGHQTDRTGLQNATAAFPPADGAVYLLHEEIAQDTKSAQYWTSFFSRKYDGKILNADPTMPAPMSFDPYIIPLFLPVSAGKLGNTTNNNNSTRSGEAQGAREPKGYVVHYPAFVRTLSSASASAKNAQLGPTAVAKPRNQAHQDGASIRVKTPLVFVDAHRVSVEMFVFSNRTTSRKVRVSNESASSYVSEDVFYKLAEKELAVMLTNLRGIMHRTALALVAFCSSDGFRIFRWNHVAQYQSLHDVTYVVCVRNSAYMEIAVESGDIDIRFRPG